MKNLILLLAVMPPIADLFDLDVAGKYYNSIGHDMLCGKSAAVCGAKSASLGDCRIGESFGVKYRFCRSRYIEKGGERVMLLEQLPASRRTKESPVTTDKRAQEVGRILKGKL